MNVTLTVDVETHFDAPVMFLNTVRTAWHAAGGATRGRPHFDPEHPLTVDAVETATA